MTSMNRLTLQLVAIAAASGGAAVHAEEPLTALRIGRAGHAFDHLGDLADQADAAAASGATIIYATGLGVCGYTGWLPEPALTERRDAVRTYNRKARQQGIELI